MAGDEPRASKRPRPDFIPMDDVEDARQAGSSMDVLSASLAEQGDPEKGLSLLLGASREATLAAISEDALEKGLDYP
eukprot:4568113-Lingulodinium_polyedra.AAC.1